jgi:DNA repair and recombination protein RAD52
MTFTLEQVEHLKAPLSSSAVKSRQQGGGKVSYVEAYHCENEANRIFGFDAWDRTTELTHIGEREQDGKWRVYYRAKVRITVRSADGGETIREGCGFGSGIDKDIGQAHESALKEAESDAEKRALKTFGNPFGQALYDKEQRDVTVDPPASVTAMLDKLRDASRNGDVAMASYWKDHHKTIPRDWLDYAIAEKESIKAGMSAVNALRAG